MNARPSTRTTRLAHLAWPYRNALARGNDRLESAMLALVVVLGLLLVPVMLVFGSIVHADMAATGEQQAHTRRPAVAVLAQDAPAASADGHGNAVIGKSMIPATWTNPDGSTGKGLVEAIDGQKAGTKIGIWLDQRGRVVDRPLNESDAAAGGVLVALTGWLVAVLLLVLAQTGLHVVLNRRRFRAWDRQWARVEPGWNNYRH